MLFDEEEVNLPQLDEVLKENLLANAPKPIADSVANFLAFRNVYQYRDRILLVFRVLVRYIGILALASHARNSSEQKDNELVNKFISILCQQELTETQWIELSRELTRPFAKKRDAFAIPELVTLFFDEGSQSLSVINKSITSLFPLQEKLLSITSLKEEEPINLLADFLAKLTLLLKTVTWLNSYYLVLPNGQQAIKWMGAIKNLSSISIKSSNVANGKAILVDENGRFCITPSFLLRNIFDKNFSSQKLGSRVSMILGVQKTYKLLIFNWLSLFLWNFYVVCWLLP